MKFLQYINKRVAGFLAIMVAVVAVGGATMAYGPERPTYTAQQPAPHITFNSITNNPNYGDERNFSLIKDASNTNEGGWGDEVTAQAGKEYLVRLFVHNNAAENLNLVATNTRVMANVPTTTGNSVQIDSFITADNASPQKVWDDVVLKSDKKFNVAYVAGSAKLMNEIRTGGAGFPLADSIVTNSGAKVGYQQMDGNLQGCFKYSAVVTFRVKVQMEQMPNFTVAKDVRLNGTTAWKDSITAEPGQKVDYRVAYTNTGEALQNNVVIKDTLPKGVTYNNGTSTVRNVSNPSGAKVADTVIQPQGINIGHYNPKSNAGLYFTATLPNKEALENCGPNKLINKATVDTDNGSKSDTAEVIVNKACAPNECKPGIPMGDARCTECVDNPKAGDNSCALPVTGPAEVIAGLLAVAAVTIGAVYYYRSRKELKSTLHNLHQ